MDLVGRIPRGGILAAEAHPATANLIANSTASTSTAGEASLTLPEISLASE